MTNDERAMLRKGEPAGTDGERFTSLQPTYEDTVPPEPDDWEEDRHGS